MLKRASFCRTIQQKKNPSLWEQNHSLLANNDDNSKSRCTYYNKLHEAEASIQSFMSFYKITVIDGS